MRKSNEDIISELREVIYDLKQKNRHLIKKLDECEEQDNEDECDECEEKKHHHCKCEEHESLLIQFNDMKIEYDKSLENCKQLQSDNINLVVKVNKCINLIKLLQNR